MKEPVEMEPLKNADEIQRFLNKELRLTKESMGTLMKFSDYCGPIRKKLYHFVSGFVTLITNKRCC